MVEGPRAQDPGRARRVALVGETYDQAREVMVMGDSGLLAVSPPDRRPVWVATRRCLRWPNGAEATCYSAQDPQALRGPQFDAAWTDEVAKWPKAEVAWDMLQFALRLGEAPRVCATTTPRAVDLLRRILALPTTVTTHAPTEANRAYLADSFLSDVRARYGGTALGRQELDGELLEEVRGALWPRRVLEDARIRTAPDLCRIVVAVDPPVTGHAGSDACGIVVVGVTQNGPPQDWRAVVLEDASVQGVSPQTWAKRAVDTARHWQAQRLVAEVNQGGDLVETVIRQIDPLVPLTKVRATMGKCARAEPVAALYEQGRVAHLPGLDALEDQMCQMTMTGYMGPGSPDRVDALVWALTEAMLVPARHARSPHLRSL